MDNRELLTQLIFVTTKLQAGQRTLNQLPSFILEKERLDGVVVNINSKIQELKELLNATNKS